TSDQRVHMICTIPALSNLDNLAARAVDMVCQRLGWRQGVRIELYKRIPLAAGLGGGSSDAAAVLLALRQWWQLPFSAADLLSKAVSAALNANSDPPLEHLHNGLERSVLERYPAVARAREDLLSAGAAVVRLSGSGPTLFAPFAELASALHAHHQMQAMGYEVY